MNASETTEETVEAQTEASRGADHEPRTDVREATDEIEAGSIRAENAPTNTIPSDRS